MQQSQSPQSGSDHLLPAERAALRQLRNRRLRAVVAGAGATVLALFASGCPEPDDLDNPPAMAGASSGGSAGAATGGSTGASTCEVQCVTDIFQKDPVLCKLCHGALLKSASLDVEAPGFTDRMKDKPALHTDTAVGMNTGCPTGDLLINTTDPGQSWLLKKIRGEQGNCGTKMPSTGNLTPAQQMCLETYISCVANNKPLPPPGGGGGSGSGGSGGAPGGGSGGASGGSGGASGGSGGASGGSGGGGGTGGT